MKLLKLTTLTLALSLALSWLFPAHAATIAGLNLAVLMPQLMPALLPVVTPLLIAGIKKLIARIPTVWLPVIAPVLAALLDALQSMFTGAGMGWWQSALLGLAGVGVREIVDQAKKATA